MKVIAAPIAAVVVGLLGFPALFATGDPAPLSCGAVGAGAAVLSTIRTLESGGDYTARAERSSASGAYQFIDATWNGYGGFPQAWQAPPETQDAKATEMVTAILDAHDGDIAAIPVVWYIGHLPAPTSPTWDTIPAAGAGNRLTPREYQQRWLAEFERHAAEADDGSACTIGGFIAPLADGFAYPGPAELFANAPVDSPHHDYPAWDWPVPVGTPIYAVRGGRVTATMYWPYNWWDHGLRRRQRRLLRRAESASPSRTRTAPDGRTATGTPSPWQSVRWSPPANRSSSQATPAVRAGHTSTSRSGWPTATLRCPQPLMRSLRSEQAGRPVVELPAIGCSY